MTAAIPPGSHKTPWLKEGHFFFSNFQKYVFTLPDTLHMKGKFYYLHFATPLEFYSQAKQTGSVW